MREVVLTCLKAQAPTLWLTGLSCLSRNAKTNHANTMFRTSAMQPPISISLTETLPKRHLSYLSSHFSAYHPSPEHFSYMQRILAYTFDPSRLFIDPLVSSFPTPINIPWPRPGQCPNTNSDREGSVPRRGAGLFGHVWTTEISPYEPWRWHIMTAAWRICQLCSG